MAVRCSAVNNVRFGGYPAHSLVVGKWVSAHAPLEYFSGVCIFTNRAKVEDPIVTTVAVVEELLRIFAAVTVEPLEPGRWVSHHDDTVGYICKVYGAVRCGR